MADSNWAEIYKELGRNAGNKCYRQRYDAGWLYACAGGARCDGNG